MWTLACRWSSSLQRVSWRFCLFLLWVHSKWEILRCPAKSWEIVLIICSFSLNIWWIIVFEAFRGWTTFWEKEIIFFYLEKMQVTLFGFWMSVNVDRKQRLIPWHQHWQQPHPCFGCNYREMPKSCKQKSVHCNRLLINRCRGGQIIIGSKEKCLHNPSIIFSLKPSKARVVAKCLWGWCRTARGWSSSPRACGYTSWRWRWSEGSTGFLATRRQ